MGDLFKPDVTQEAIGSTRTSLLSENQRRVHSQLSQLITKLLRGGLFDQPALSVELLQQVLSGRHPN